VRRKAIHLAIVSYPAQLDATLEEIAQTLARGVDGTRVLERAQAHSDLRFLVRQWHLRQREVVTLDLIGHGAAGRLALGDELLFASDGTGLELADELAPFLSPRARVRLLGCGVGNVQSGGFDGGTLLRALECRLGAQRRVFAPTRALTTRDYLPSGLTPAALRALTGSTTHRRKHGRSKAVGNP